MANTLITQLNNPVVLQKLNQHLATIVSLLLIIACAYLLVEITWLFFPQDDEAMPISMQQKKGMNVASQAQQNNFRQLTAANIFGVSDKAPIKRQTKVPETKLNLTLKGVLAAKPQERASAIIAKGKSGKEDIYSIGDKMQGGVEVKEIYPDHVVLSRNGQLETLKLQKTSGLGNLGQSGHGRKSLSSASLRAGSPGAALKEIRNNIIKDPTSFGEYALPVVVKEKGKQIGYRLQPQKKGQLLAELGIESSDVITQINGIKLDKPQNGISALRKLSTAKNLSIVVKRNGAEVPLNISLP
ncbi:MAG TPA: type II secretion system protein GspC [Gammaproteobacteria bacterium]|nr:type II secretion system protein GspC [Gammaproteobacteria bacterium]